MPEALFASSDSGLVSELARRLTGIPIYPASSPQAVSGHLPSACLLIVDDRCFGGAIDLLPDWRTSSPDIPVIYCLDPAADARLVRRLVLELGVKELVFHPIDPETLARQAASILGLPYTGAADEECGAVPQDALSQRLAETWSRAKSKMLARIELLEQAGSAWLEKRLDTELRLQAQNEAHKLAGSLGTFGLPAGSRFARELERTLEGGLRVSESQALRFLEVAAALRLEVERSPAFVREIGARAADDPALRPVLLVSDDTELAARLTEEAAARRWVWQAASDASEAGSSATGSNPAAVLIDVDTASAGHTLDFLSELAARTPPVPAIILTSAGTLMDRVEVARRGGRGFFLRSLPPAEIVEATRALIERLQPKAHVIAVDDDQTVLDAVSVLLGSHGIRLTALNDPLELWGQLEGSPPDLLLLDIEMPKVSGIELCRVVRNDLRWAAIPIVFLTSLTDPDTVRRVFASGADDFVAKPVVGPELVTRISNRLERTRLLRAMAEVDARTGLPNRAKCRQAFADFLRLADRHGQPMGLAMLSVDGLERVNETYGSPAGDEVLRQLGQCLREDFHSEEIAGRWSGNEFVLGLYGLDRGASFRRVQDLLTDFSHRLFVGRRSSNVDPVGDSREFKVTLSGGVAGYPEDASDLDGLLLAASQGRRRAKAQGGNGLQGPVAEQVGLRPLDLAVISGDDATTTLLTHKIESDGYRTRVLRSGLTAARVLSGPEPSLRARVLLVDVDSPGFDALRFVEELASEGVLHETALLVLSSAAWNRNANHALELGAADVIAKPVDLPALLIRVRQELHRNPSPLPIRPVPAGLIERL